MADAADAVTDTANSSNNDLDCLCLLDGVMDLLSRRYAMRLICVVGAIGPARYGDIQETFDGVSSSTLSTRLDELVEAGILTREQYAEIPPRVEYELTEMGQELGQHLDPVLEWAEEVDEGDVSVGSE